MELQINRVRINRARPVDLLTSKRRGINPKGKGGVQDIIREFVSENCKKLKKIVEGGGAFIKFVYVYPPVRRNQGTKNYLGSVSPTFGLCESQA